MYLITDSYGTKQRAWTRKTALEWLACCSDDARIVNVWGKTVAVRKIY
jgi:hypothetical protein